MFELMQKLVAFKYACKLNHWETKSYAEHLLFDRLQEDVDDLIDDIAEKYFMATGKNAEKDLRNILQPTFINMNLEESIQDIIRLTEKLCKEEKSESVIALISGIGETFMGKLALAGLK
jgi:DNA-binding ferritin-like protein